MNGPKPNWLQVLRGCVFKFVSFIQYCPSYQVHLGRSTFQQINAGRCGITTIHSNPSMPTSRSEHMFPGNSGCFGNMAHDIPVDKRKSSLSCPASGTIISSPAMLQAFAALTSAVKPFGGSAHALRSNEVTNNIYSYLYYPENIVDILRVSALSLFFFIST